MRHLAQLVHGDWGGHVAAGEIDTVAFKQIENRSGCIGGQRDRCWNGVGQLQEVVGFFTSVLPIRTTIEDEMTFAEYLEAFRSDLAADLSNDEVTLEDIISHTKTSPQDRSHVKHLFAGGLNMRIANRLGASDITAAVVSLPNGGEKYELSLTAHYETGEVTLGFDNRLYTEGSARQFLAAYCGLIDTLGRDPHLKISDVSVVSSKGQSRLAM